MLSGYDSKASINVLMLSVKVPNLDSESDVYRRRILTSKEGPRTERVKSRSIIFTTR